jgi:hypothetical protein
VKSTGDAPTLGYRDDNTTSKVARTRRRMIIYESIYPIRQWGRRDWRVSRAGACTAYVDGETEAPSFFMNEARACSRPRLISFFFFTPRQ